MARDFKGDKVVRVAGGCNFIELRNLDRQSLNVTLNRSSSIYEKVGCEFPCSSIANNIAH